MSDRKTPKFLLVDGHSLVYRAFFALPDTLATAEGHPTNAVLGFAQMLLRFLDEEKPDYVAVAFDAGRPEFRMEEFAAYKAQRKPTPDKLRSQFPLVKEFLEALRAPAVEVDGYEGDDILAALAELARREETEVLILTGDRDTLQLVRPGVRVIITLRGISETAVFDVEAVKARYGVTPEQLPDFKGLVGDPSDNLPGVPGVGEKTAAALLSRFGDLNTLLSRLDEVTPDRLRRSLEAHADGARQCRSVGTIRREVPFAVKPRLDDFRHRGWDEARLAEFLRRMEFRALLRRLGLAEKAAAQGSLFSDLGAEVAGGSAAGRGLVRRRRLIGSLEELERLAKVLERAPRLALAVSLDGERPPGARLTALALAAEDEMETCHVPLNTPLATGIDETGALRVLGPLLSAPRPVKLTHAAKPFLVRLLAAGLRPVGFGLDTELGAYLLDPSRYSYSPEALARELAGEDVLLPDGPPEGWRPDAAGLDWPAERLCLEADIVLAVADPLRRELADKDLAALLDEVEMPLEVVLAEMELAGVGVDKPSLGEMSTELGRRIAELGADIYAMAGEEFNINSPRQLGQVLFEKLKLPAGRKTATGAHATGAEVLEELAVSHEIVARILEYRHLAKLKGTYTDGMASLVDPTTGRLHTVFKQTVTATGRLSSAEPNLQNIPVREEVGRRIRRVFVAAEGHVLLAGDYSQIELRVMAHLSGDPTLTESFRLGQDIHQRTASEVFGVPMDEVTPELRFRAKAVNFGIIYGITDFGLARGLGVGREEAGAFINDYLGRYPMVGVFVNRTLAEARSRGYVTTVLNRRRYLPELHSSNRVQRQFAERAARNTPIQGTAADIIKLAMVGIRRELEEKGLRSRMILQVHDELLFEVPEEELPAMAALVKEKMEGVMKLDVPLQVDLKTGPNWYAMDKLRLVPGDA